MKKQVYVSGISVILMLIVCMQVVEASDCKNKLRDGSCIQPANENMMQSNAGRIAEPQIHSPIQPNLNYGPNWPVRHRISAWGFTPSGPGCGYSSLYYSFRYFYDCSCGIWFGPLTLPSGALITYFGAEIIDSNATYNICIVAEVCPDSSTDCTLIASACSSGSPGHNYIGGYLTTPVTVDNFFNTYQLYVSQNVNGCNGTLAFRSVEVDYMLQASPAPAYATFLDVPTSHIFFQYVEALAASGITTGCTSNLYCPDNYVTRGQMAAFLSRALGLNWPY